MTQSDAYAEGYINPIDNLVVERDADGFSMEERDRFLHAGIYLKQGELVCNLGNSVSLTIFIFQRKKGGRERKKKKDSAKTASKLESIYSWQSTFGSESIFVCVIWCAGVKSAQPSRDGVLREMFSIDSLGTYVFFSNYSFVIYVFLFMHC